MKKYIPHATVLAVITIVFGSIYTIGQQTIRLSANMPQIQVAEDAALALNNGAQPNSVLPQGKKVDIGDSSAGFVIIYDKSGKAIAGSGEMDGKLPVIPFGVLQSTPPTGYHAITWVPESGVRVASVEVRTNNYYVLAGRSLNEPEKLIETIGRLTLIGYALALLTTAGGTLLWHKTKK
jgi:hypothetical protein